MPKNRIVFYGIGVNKYNIDISIPKKTIHAEVDAINHLKPLPRGKKKKVMMFVFRVNGTSLRMARPCESCINYIQKHTERKGYRMKRIYYTDWDGKVVRY